MPGGSSVGRSFMECTARSTLPSTQGLVDLLGEQSFAAEIAQGLLADAIAGRGDDGELDVALVEAMSGDQERPHMPSLPERKRAASGANQERAFGQALDSLGSIGGAGPPPGINGPIRLPLQSDRVLPCKEHHDQRPDQGLPPCPRHRDELR